MSDQLGEAVLDLNTDATKYNRGLDAAEKRANEFGERATKASGKAGSGLKDAGKEADGLGVKLGSVAQIGAGFALGAGFTAIPALLGSSIGAASDLAEAQSKVNVVFGESADEIHKFTKSAATNLGVSTAQAEAAAGTFGNLFVAMGLGAEPAADLSKGILTLGSDLASFNNIKPEEALEKLRAGLVGEAEPLRALGVNMNAAMVEAKAFEMGLQDANGELSESAKVQARYAIIMEQTKTAQGDFARTSEGLANQQRIMKAQFADASAQLGQALIPMFLALSTVLTQGVIPALAVTLFPALQGVGTAIKFITDNFTMLLPLIAGIAAGLGVALVAALAVVIPMIWAKAAAWTAAALAAMAANAPLLILIATVALVVAAVVLLIQHWDTLTAKFPILQQVADAVKGGLQSFLSFITGSFVPGVTGGFTAIVNTVQTLWPTIAPIFSAAITVWTGLFTAFFTVWAALFQGTFDIIMGIVDVFVGLFTGDWERMFDGIRRITDGAFTILKGIFDGQLAIIKSVWEAAFNFLNTITGGKFGEIVSAITSGLDTATGVIGTFVSNMWSWGSQIADAIYNAGQAFWTFRDWIVSVISEVLGWVEALISKIRSIPSPGDVLHAGGSFNPMNWQTGGRNVPRGWAVVGEQGPELVHLNGGEDIYNTRQTMSMFQRGLDWQDGGGAVGGGGIAVNFNGPTEILARDKRDAERGAGDVGWAAMQAMKARGVA